MFSIFKQTYSATGVEHAIYCRFYGHNRNEKNLVVAGANALRIFRLTSNNPADSAWSARRDVGNKMKLECLATYTLHGNVMSMASATLPGSSRNVLLLGFSNAKLSLVEYDPVADNIKTLSLHNFEGICLFCGG